MFKIVNATTSTVIKENLDYYQARYEIEGRDELVIMDQDLDVTVGLERRQKFIDATAGPEYA